MKLKITNPDGSFETLEHDAETIEAFVNEKFGSSYAAFVFGGGSIEEVDDAPTEPDQAQLDAEDEALK